MEIASQEEIDLATMRSFCGYDFLKRSATVSRGF